MNKYERILTIVMRVSAVVLLSAIAPALFPHAWMDAIHRRLGLGELPEIPIVGYLTRSASALYALHGALILYISLDVRRYLGFIRFLSCVSVVFGLGMLLIDVSVGLPGYWACAEGPFIAVASGLLYWLATKAGQAPAAG